MARKITVKNIQESFSCECGYNSSTPYKEVVSHKLLLLEGAKRKKDKKTNVVFYLLVINAESCHECGSTEF